MIFDYTIGYLKKLTYIDKIEKTKNFSILLYYDNEKKFKKVSRRIGPANLINILNKIKQEIKYEDEKTDKTMPFYVI
jgi:hypothetical protein